MHRQTDGQTDRQTDRQTHIQANRQAHTHTHTQTQRDTDTDKHACTHKHTHTHVECCPHVSKTALQNLQEGHDLRTEHDSEQHCNLSEWHTLRPSSEARSADTSTKAAAPSAMMELLPAVTVPPSLEGPSLTKAGGRLRSLSGFTFNTGKARFASVY